MEVTAARAIQLWVKQIRSGWSSGTTFAKIVHLAMRDQRLRGMEDALTSSKGKQTLDPVAADIARRQIVEKHLHSFSFFNSNGFDISLRLLEEASFMRVDEGKTIFSLNQKIDKVFMVFDGNVGLFDQTAIDFATELETNTKEQAPLNKRARSRKQNLEGTGQFLSHTQTPLAKRRAGDLFGGEVTNRQQHTAVATTACSVVVFPRATYERFSLQTQIKLNILKLQAIKQSPLEFILSTDSELEACMRLLRPVEFKTGQLVHAHGLAGYTKKGHVLHDANRPPPWAPKVALELFWAWVHSAPAPVSGP
jgi:hypothetical protein